MSNLSEALSRMAPVHPFMMNLDYIEYRMEQIDPKKHLQESKRNLYIE